MNYRFLFLSYLIFKPLNILAFKKYIIGYGGSGIRYLACDEPNKRLRDMKTFTNEDKQKLLREHNTFRGKVAAGDEPNQPPSENMQEMVWSDNAERQAYDWVSRCIFEHNQPLREDGTFMGQNLYMHSVDTSLSVDDAFKTADASQEWFSEVSKYTYGPEWSPETGHYIQMVQANSSAIGCAYSYYDILNSDWSEGILACNYDPNGGYLNQLPYISGNSNCEKYNLVKSKNYPNLCIKIKN